MINKQTDYNKNGLGIYGTIPDSWEVKKLKYVSEINKSDLSESVSSDFQFKYIDISSVSGEGRIRKTQSFKFSEAPSRARRVVEVGDTIISTVRTYLRAIALIDDKHSTHIVSTGFAVVHPGKDVNSEYFNYLALSEPFIQQIVSLSKGVSYPAITSRDLSSIPIVIPPLSLQVRISIQLTNKVRVLDKLLSNNKRLIKLLEEKKKALINNVITKGLNPEIEMKDSCVEWIGQIPLNWKVKKGKYLFKIISGDAPLGLEPKEDGVVYLKVDDLNYTSSEDFSLVGIKKKVLYGNPYNKRAILFPKRGAAIMTNKIAIIEGEYIFDTNLMGLHLLNDGMVLEYFTYQIKARSLGDIADTSTIPQINNKHIYPLKFSVPPVTEQRQIVDFLRREVKNITTLVDRYKKQNQLLKEYKQSLIYHVVTGKVDVRDEEKY